MNRATPRLILGSTSRYRADLLRRLGIDFTQCAPQIDEAELAAESAPTRALRLAIAKAEAAAREQDAQHAVEAGLRALLQQRLWIRDHSTQASVDEFAVAATAMQNVRERLQPLLRALAQAQSALDNAMREHIRQDGEP